jgi:hypothetical protein
MLHGRNGFPKPVRNNSSDAEPVGFRGTGKPFDLDGRKT